jgi:hypothetical protein
MSLVKNGISSSGKQKYFCKKCVKHCSGTNHNMFSKNTDNYQSSGQIIKNWLNSQGISVKEYLKIR